MTIEEYWQSIDRLGLRVSPLHPIGSLVVLIPKDGREPGYFIVRNPSHQSDVARRAAVEGLTSKRLRPLPPEPF